MWKTPTSQVQQINMLDFDTGMHRLRFHENPPFDPPKKLFNFELKNLSRSRCLDTKNMHIMRIMHIMHIVHIVHIMNVSPNPAWKDSEGRIDIQNT